MRKLSLIIIFFQMAFFPLLVPNDAKAMVGVNVAGNGCWSSAPIASQAYLIGMDIGLTALLQNFISDFMQAISEQTVAMQSANSKIEQGGQNAAAERAAQTMTAEANINAYSRQVFDMPVNYCLDPAYYLQRNKEDTQAALASMAAMERNNGLGMTSSSAERAQQLRLAAKSVEKAGFPFASDTFTPDQTQAFGDIIQVLFSSSKNPRPSSLKSGTIEESRYLVGEQAASLFRVLATQPYRQFEMDRYPYAVYKELGQWAGEGVNSPFTVSFDVDEKTGKVKDVAGKIQHVGPNDKISLLAIYNLVGKRFTSKDFLNKLDGLKAAGVLKEIIRLLGFEYNVMLDMRNMMQYNNVLMSLSLIDKYEDMNRNVDQIIK